MNMIVRYAAMLCLALWLCTQLVDMLATPLIKEVSMVNAMLIGR